MGLESSSAGVDLEEILKNLIQARRILLALFTVSFITIFSVGCGDSGSRDAFVATGGNTNQQIATGNLAFNFVRATPQTTLPSSTATVRIDLYSGTVVPANLVFSQRFAFANTITVTGVPVNVTTAIITVLDSNGLFLTRLSVPVTVTADQTTQIDTSTGSTVAADFTNLAVQPNPINLLLGTFSQSTSVQSQLVGTIAGENYFLPIVNSTANFSIASTSVANVSSAGVFDTTLIGSGGFGNTTATVTYTINGQQQTANADVFVRFFFIVPNNSISSISQGSTYDSGYSATFFDSNGTQTNITDNVTYALESAVQGVTVSSAGVVTTSSNTPIGSFNVIATWVDGRTNGTGLTFTQTIPFTVVTASDE